MQSTSVSPGRLQALGIAMALSAGTLWGVSGTIGQYLYANTDIDGGLLSSIRMPLAGLILFGYALFTQKKQVFAIFRHWKDALLLVAYALFGMLALSDRLSGLHPVHQCGQPPPCCNTPRRCSSY